MRLTDLVSFAREIDRVHDDEPPEPRAPGTIEQFDGPRLERAPVPVWLRDRAPTDLIHGPEHLLLRVEEEFDPGGLPPDVRQPNPHIDTLLAYYKPFHLHGSDWGIYLRESGVLVVASILTGSASFNRDPVFVDLARELLLEHEVLHFQTEVACTRAEVVAKRRLYRPYFADDLATAHEEALANAASFRTLRREPPSIQNRVTAWMEHQGRGYRDFESWVRPAQFSLGCRRATHHMLKNLPAATAPGPGEFLFDSMRRFKPPTYVVPDVSFATLLKPFPKAHGMKVAVHTRGEHPPPHIHVFVPPEREFTILEWPSLLPRRGHPPMSSSRAKGLEAYLTDFGAEIDAKIRKVFSNVPPWIPKNQRSS